MCRDTRVVRHARVYKVSEKLRRRSRKRQDMDEPDGSADRSLVRAKFCPNFALLIDNGMHRFTLLLRTEESNIRANCIRKLASRISSMKLFRKKYLKMFKFYQNLVQCLKFCISDSSNI